MLKKLVKYGNSNAIILDKAILELLEIGEGSVIKIKTDGKSIIITPQEKAPEVVQETFTAEDAQMQANIQERLKKVTINNPYERDYFEKELFTLYKKHRELGKRGNPELLKKIQDLSKTMDTKSPDYLHAWKELRKKHTPELVAVEEEINQFESKHNLTPKEFTIEHMLTDEQISAMHQDFKTLFEEFNLTNKGKNTIYHLDDPNYQHEAQLIAEKYSNDKNSADYLKDMDALMQKFNPEMHRYQQKVKEISDKYTKLVK